MNQIISALLIVGITGLIFGAILEFAAVIFAVKKDERAEKIQEILPGANCGACGFAGCAAYAQAIVKDGAKTNLCSVGKSPVAAKIGEIMGKAEEETEEMRAVVMCGGICGKAEEKYIYSGLRDCNASMRLSGGAKVCEYGCLGLGTCLKACKFGAISIENGIAKVDPEKCTGCGMCKKVCPKHVISMIPKQSSVCVLCKNEDKGAAVNKYCSAGCIGCKICEKNCPNEAIKVIDNRAVIDYEKCTSCGICVEKCPKKVIKI